MKVFRNILLDNHYNTTDQRLKHLRPHLQGIPLNKSFPLQTEQQELKLKQNNTEIGRTKIVLLMIKQNMQ